MSRKRQILALLVACGMGLTLAAKTPQAPSGTVATPVLADLARVVTAGDVDRVRDEVLRAVFGEASVPDAMPASVLDVEVPGFGAARKLRIPLVTGEEQTSFYLSPTHDAGQPRLAIYHAGHKQQALVEGAETVLGLRAAGYHVLAFSMLSGDHSRYAGLDRPLQPFLEHVAVGLNYALSVQNFESVLMAGLSGGGWTTVLYAAIDPRIDQSFPVAGSYPTYLRDLQPKSRGDFEQALPGLEIDYLDLYIMAASAGRRQVQIFNRDDPCCFSDGLALSYRDFVAGRATALGGGFDVVIDDSDRHELSDRGLRSLLALSRSTSPQGLARRGTSESGSW